MIWGSRDAIQWPLAPLPPHEPPCKPFTSTAMTWPISMSAKAPASGPPLVCVHGSLCDFRIWSSVLGPLTRNHRVIAPSLRHFFPEHWDGVGDTYSIAQHVDDVIGFIEKLDTRPGRPDGPFPRRTHLLSRRAAAAGSVAQADPGRAWRRARRHARSRLQARPLAAGRANRGFRRGDRQGRYRWRPADFHGCAGRSRRLEAAAGDA